MEEKERIDFEARLLEQEHRPFTLIKNYINRKQWNEEDPRRKAVKTALLWRIFFSPTMIAGGGGLIALGSLFILFWQTEVLVTQNKLLIEQNKKINDQTYLIEAQRRSALQFELSEILNRVDSELSRKGNKEKRLSLELKSRIIAATISMKPYRSYENDSLSQPYSYEKGQLFAYLVNSNVNLLDLKLIFQRANFSNMILEKVVLGANNKETHFSFTTLEGCYFKNVYFRNFKFDQASSFKDSRFVDCHFWGLRTDPLSFVNSNIVRTSFFWETTKEDHKYLNTNPWISFNNTNLDNCLFGRLDRILTQITKGGNPNEVTVSFLGNSKLINSVFKDMRFNFDSYFGSSTRLNNVIFADSIASKSNISLIDKCKNANNIFALESFKFENTCFTKHLENQKQSIFKFEDFLKKLEKKGSSFLIVHTSIDRTQKFNLYNMKKD